MLYTGAQLGVLALCWTLAPLPAHTYIYAHHNNLTSLFEDLPAMFGSELPKEGLMGLLVESRPLNGCTPIEPPPSLPTSSDVNVTKFIVLIRRYDCNFDMKVLHAQQAGFSAAIVHNMYSDGILNMNYSNDTIANEIQIPSVFTSFSASKKLLEFIPEQGSYVILKPEFAFPLSYYLIPFTGVVGMIILVMVVILIVRCVQYRKRMRKNRLTKEQLKRIPIHKFSKGDEYDVCAICLDEYEEGDKLRVLPCSHAYHCKCVDVWLTQTKKTCPVCKQRVSRPNPEYESVSEDDWASVGEEDDEGTADTERTPLLRPCNPASPSSGSPGTYSATVVTEPQPSASVPPPTASTMPWGITVQEDTDSESGEDEGEETQPSIAHERVLWES